MVALRNMKILNRTVSLPVWEKYDILVSVDSEHLFHFICDSFRLTQWCVKVFRTNGWCVIAHEIRITNTSVTIVIYNVTYCFGVRWSTALRTIFIRKITDEEQQILVECLLWRSNAIFSECSGTLCASAKFIWTKKKINFSIHMLGIAV